MKQVTKEIVQRLLHNYKFEFQSTQNKLCIPIINRLYRKMLLGIKFSGIKVCDDLIIDGHHRYFASVLAQVNLDKIPSQKATATTVTDWSSVVFIEEDWDTEAKIDMLNKLDADFNNIPLEQIVESLK